MIAHELACMQNKNYSQNVGDCVFPRTDIGDKNNLYLCGSIAAVKWETVVFVLRVLI